MSFLKKLFTSTSPKTQSNPTHQSDLLASYKSVPWMTDVRLENVAICLNAGFVPSRSLPTQLERQLRPKIEIAKRLNAIKAMVLWLMIPAKDLADKDILHFVESNELYLFMTEDEKQIFHSSREDEALRNAIGWKFENAWPLAWYFGYVPPDISGQMMTGEQMQEIVFKYKCPLTEKIEDWLGTKEVVPEEELRKHEDLFYCLHNAVRSAQMGGQTVPPGFDPRANGGVIHERRHALTWMLSKGMGWDETDLST